MSGGLRNPRLPPGLVHLRIVKCRWDPNDDLRSRVSSNFDGQLGGTSSRTDYSNEKKKRLMALTGLTSSWLLVSLMVGFLRRSLFLEFRYFNIEWAFFDCFWPHPPLGCHSLPPYSLSIRKPRIFISLINSTRLSTKCFYINLKKSCFLDKIEWLPPKFAHFDIASLPRLRKKLGRNWALDLFFSLSSLFQISPLLLPPLPPLFLDH